MIWITTLCLLAVAAWLFFNALNERRWVEAHSHDETVASDEGLFPSLTAKTNTATDSGTPGHSSDGTPLSRTGNRLQGSTQKMGEHLKGAKQKASNMYERAKQPDGALSEDSFAGRTLSKAKEQASKLNKKIDAGMKSASSVKNGSADGEGSVLGRAAAKSGDLTQKAAQKVKASADSLVGKTNSQGEEGMLSKIAGKVSGGMAAVDQKLDRSVSDKGDQIAEKMSDTAKKAAAAAETK